MPVKRDVTAAARRGARALFSAICLSSFLPFLLSSQAAKFIVRVAPTRWHAERWRFQRGGSALNCCGAHHALACNDAWDNAEISSNAGPIARGTFYGAHPADGFSTRRRTDVSSLGGTGRTFPSRCLLAPNFLPPTSVMGASR